MKLVLISIFVSIVFVGCSQKTVPNKWQFQSADTFNSYKENFLKGNTHLARSDLKKALEYSKQSGNIDHLAKIYLGVCGLNKTIDSNYQCTEYENTRDLLLDKDIDKYYLMLENTLEEKDILYLPKQYQRFMFYKLNREYTKAFKTIKEIDSISSKYIAASLIQPHLTIQNVNYLIHTASYYGHKTFVVYWLKYLYTLEKDFKQKKQIEKKIKILES